MKSPEILDWLALVFFLLNAGTEASGGEVEKPGVLGGSVTFQLENFQPSMQIIWLKRDSKKDFSTVAFLTPGNPCQLNIWDPAFIGRLNVSEDCRRLEIRDLTRDDSGRYKADKQNVEKDELKEIFDLQVYKRLSGADLAIQCNKTGNETRRLKCSVGPWEEGVRFCWVNTSKAENLGNSSILELRANAPDFNLTCTATNPVSNASRRVSLKEVCEAEHPGTRTSTDSTPTHVNKGNIGTSVGIAAVVILVVMLIVGLIIWFCRKKRKAGHWKHPDSAETEEQSKTIYAEVENVPTVVRNQEPRRGGKPVKTEKEKIQTIYTTVDHYKLSPLQTDDEKMQKGRRPPPEQTAKTTYAEISAPQESEDRGIKSIYDTVKNPQLPGGTEYDVNI